ncbi:MAG: iron-containing redox enzyme family protein [Telluria sp.]
MHESFVDRVHGNRALIEVKARSLYFALNVDTPDDDARSRAKDYLGSQLRAAQDAPCALPEDPSKLNEWMIAGVDEVGQSYRDYLGGRRKGEPRRYFPTRAHALAFLQRVAPTKMVDGAWLYGTLERWHEAAFRPLITTYLEELGSGIEQKNHVALYKSLLTAEGCEQWGNLSDKHFIQGAIQLSLAWNVEHFLPELIGFNLGYEQLPLHLLITSYELNELGIDPYYFVLHVTVDNASTGHALKAIEALHALMPRVGDTAEFYRRVRNGFLLNELGVSTNQVIASFDLDAELVRVLAAKSSVGKHMHSDYCKLAGRTVNAWLAEPAQIPAFLEQLVGAGWIRRGARAEESRFWRLIQGENAEMFGVFTAYEQEVLRAWIEHPKFRDPGAVDTSPRPPSHRALRRMRETSFASAQRPSRNSARPLLGRHAAGALRDDQGFGSDMRLLEQQLANMESKQEAMRHLRTLMSPALHHTPAGLMATRIFQRMLE